MSYVHISDPAKRQEIIADLIKSRKAIYQDDLSRKLGVRAERLGVEKQLAPVTEGQKGIIELLKTIPEATAQATAQALPSTTPMIEAPSQPMSLLNVGPTAVKYLSGHDGMDSDKLFGIYRKDGQLFIGLQPIAFEGDDIIINGSPYKGTPGLWELLTKVEPRGYTENDVETYQHILFNTKAIYQDLEFGGKSPSKPKASRSSKYRNIIKPIWDKVLGQPREKRRKAARKLLFDIEPKVEGEGLSDDPNEMLLRFDLLMTSRRAGNTGLECELRHLQKALRAYDIHLEI